MARFLATIMMVCVIASTATSDQTAPSLRDEVQHFVQEYVKAQNTLNASAIMEMISRTPEGYSVWEDKITRGWDAIRNETEQAVGAKGKLIISIGIVDVESLGKDYALAVTPVVTTLKTNQGDVQIRGAMSLILVKSAGKWKVFHEHTSIKTPPVEK